MIPALTPVNKTLACAGELFNSFYQVFSKTKLSCRLVELHEEEQQNVFLNPGRGKNCLVLWCGSSVLVDARRRKGTPCHSRNVGSAFTKSLLTKKILQKSDNSLHSKVPLMKCLRHSGDTLTHHDLQ